MTIEAEQPPRPGTRADISFKTCPKCQHNWKTRQELLMDADVSLIGLQVSPDLFENSFYLFNHQLTDKSCSTTFSIKVLCFLDMYDGPAHEKIRMGSRECPGKCLTVDNFERCDAPCKNAIARLIMALIIDRYGNARTGHSADNTADSAERRSQPHSTVR